MRLRKRSTAGASFGEHKAATRERQKIVILGVLFSLGLLTGFLVGYHDAADLILGTRQWPPALSIGLSLSYLGALAGGSVALSRHTDEFERARQYKAVALASLVYMVVYPVWLLLWFGGLAPEPMHLVLFGLFWLSLAAGSLYYKFR